ncbi:MAG: peptidoglycan-binding protein [Acidimicrobiia bacterium]|nr:peptidoglycan-binding protein [Acidimicrobiia bacterium]
MRLYHRGDRGEAVRDVQSRLRALGFGIEGDRLGVFGDGTEHAVAAFQSARGLPADGIVGPDTWRALVDASHRLGDRLLYHRVPMLRGDDVAELQARLNSLGFDTGKVDGIFGPDTLAGVIDFQQNRGLAEDGIAGPIIAGELRLVDTTARKHGREAVRERQWLSSLPRSIAGQRIYLDPECRTADEAEATWVAASQARSAIGLLGGDSLLSRSIDTSPQARLRAQRANRLNVDLVVGFFVPSDRVEGVFYFESAHSRSEAGKVIAEILAERLAIPAAGRSMPMLKDTRSPAVVVSMRSMSRRAGTIVAHAVASLYEMSAERQPSGSNR